MKKIGFVIAMAVIALALTGSALAQGDASYYFVTYFSNNVSGAPYATVRIINDGDAGTDLWANFYVFDDSEEMSECCSCPITPDGLLSESVQKELTANPVSGPVRQRGVIKVVTYNNTNVSTLTGLHGWATHIQKATSGYAVTETPLADSNLGDGEGYGLGYICNALLQLGSGRGSCTCTPEDKDF